MLKPEVLINNKAAKGAEALLTVDHLPEILIGGIHIKSRERYPNENAFDKATTRGVFPDFGALEVGLEQNLFVSHAFDEVIDCLRLRLDSNLCGVKGRPGLAFANGLLIEVHVWRNAF